MRSDPSPWAREQLSASTRNQIAIAEPATGRFHISRGRHDWRALVTFNGHVLADERRGSADTAALAALERLGTSIDS